MGTGSSRQKSWSPTGDKQTDGLSIDTKPTSNNEISNLQNGFLHNANTHGDKKVQDCSFDKSSQTSKRQRKVSGLPSQEKLHSSSYKCLSRRAMETINIPNFLMKWNSKIIKNSYHEVHNPQGIVNLGIAENSLCEDIISKKMNEPLPFTRNMQYYFPYKGIPSFRESLAKFLSERLAGGNKLSAQNIVVTNGVGSAFDLLSYFFADPGDCFLCMAPYYSMLYTNLANRSHVRCWAVQMSPKDTEGCGAFEFTVEDLEAGYQNAINQGEKVCGIILLNPHNPTGKVYSTQLLHDVLHFAARYDLHVIMDEIYALSVFDPKVTFNSILALQNIPNKEKVHHLWGFSKDFGLSGTRCGVVYSWNQAFLDHADKLLYFGSVPSLIQERLCMLINDKEWLDEEYFPTTYARMRSSYKCCVQHLRALSVPIHEPEAGFFIFANFQEYLCEQSKAGEIELFQDLMAGGVYMIPGTEWFFQEPGWFRITFTAPKHILDKGFQRMTTVLRKCLQSRDPGISGPT